MLTIVFTYYAENHSRNAFRIMEEEALEDMGATFREEAILMDFLMDLVHLVDRILVAWGKGVGTLRKWVIWVMF